MSTVDGGFPSFYEYWRKLYGKRKKTNGMGNDMRPIYLKSLRPIDKMAQARHLSVGDFPRRERILPSHYPLLPLAPPIINFSLLAGGFAGVFLHAGASSPLRSAPTRRARRLPLARRLAPPQRPRSCPCLALWDVTGGRPCALCPSQPCALPDAEAHFFSRSCDPVLSTGQVSYPDSVILIYYNDTKQGLRSQGTKTEIPPCVENS
nr:unnamed protein product [Digitaria exilis]